MVRLIMIEEKQLRPSAPEFLDRYYDSMQETICWVSLNLCPRKVERTGESEKDI
jgi:hypothetical protein